MAVENDVRHPPVILHVPHSSSVVPADVRPQFVLDDAELHRELLRMTDWYTDELFALPPDEALTLRFPVSRLAVDPERFLDPAAETMERVGMGAVYTKTSDGAPLRDAAVAAREREALLARFYHPHHAELDRAAAAALAAHGRCLIVDCHSFPSRPLPYELKAAKDPDRVRHRPAVCIGTDRTGGPQRASALGGLHTPSWLRELAADIFTEMLVDWPLGNAVTRDVAFDRPFGDTIVPRCYLGKDACVLSLMVELRRDLYMDEASGGRAAGFAGCAAAVQAALRRLIAACGA